MLAADPASVSRFGTGVAYPDFGPLESCRLDLTTTAGELVHLTVDLRSAGVVERIVGPRVQAGAVTLIRSSPDDTLCGRVLVLPDGPGVVVVADRAATATTDLCAIADAATTHIATALAGGGPARRDVTTAGWPLADVDVCALLAEPALARVSGLDAARREPGFAGWGDPAGPGSSVGVGGAQR